MLTNLPIEIWQIILRNVVHIDGALVTRMTTQFEWLDWRYNEKSKYAESMANKRSVVRVCKMWYRLGVELLYQDIRLLSLDQTQRLRDTLCTSNPEQSGHEHGNGWWTKRLDFSYQIMALMDFKSFLHSLLTHFPNLHILRFSHALYVPVGSAFLPPKLRYAFLHPGRQEDHFSPYLDTLFLVLSYTQTCTFSNLTALEVYFNNDPTILTNYSFPNIRHLTIHHNFNLDTPALRSFLERYGPQLLSLNVSYWEANLLPLTPNIKELVIRPYCIEPPQNNQSCPSVRHVGILLAHFNWHAAVRDPFLDASRLPNVKRIKLDAPVFSPGDSPIKFEEYRDLYHANGLVQRGVRFEDAEGNTWSDMIDHKSTPAALMDKAF